MVSVLLVAKMLGGAVAEELVNEDSITWGIMTQGVMQFYLKGLIFLRMYFKEPLKGFRPQR